MSQIRFTYIQLATLLPGSCSTIQISFYQAFTKQSCIGKNLPSKQKKNMLNINVIPVPNGFIKASKSVDYSSDAMLKQNIKRPQVNPLYCVKPIYYISRVFGMLPFTIVCTPTGEIDRPKVGPFDFVWFVISLLFHSILTYVTCTILLVPARWHPLYILLCGNRWLLVLGNMLGVSQVILDMWNRKRFVNILKQLNAFDNEVGLHRFCTFFFW